ncbi:MAG TPA: DUF1852 domain-containing protein [Pseudomonas sp.]|nr:DUF1852 domain-containing protein [Pseudomonas sp.]
MNSPAFDFTLSRVAFDEHYRPADTTRITTNFANLARGEHRQENLRNTLAMINHRFNALACWDNPKAERFALELEIVSGAVQLDSNSAAAPLPLIEILQTTIIDRHTQTRTAGMLGNNFSSYVRDYDFSVLLAQHNEQRPNFSAPENFGVLHGQLFKQFVNSAAYREQFAKSPVICLSVSTSKTYRRTDNHHPVLGVEYRQDAHSLTDQYFAHMGLQVRYFMPTGSVAPLAFYFAGDLLNDYSNLELISTISTMDTFQKIYRPEIYNANAAAGAVFQPSLQHADHSLTRIVYDRAERARLAVEQGRFAEAHFIKPHQALLQQWLARHAA